VRVYVNDLEITLAEGMTVRHAITPLTGGLTDLGDWIILDRWGNRIGLDGALQDGERITAEMAPGRKDN
jgi:hypothetical protein